MSFPVQSDGAGFKNISANTASFTLVGGKYAVSGNATGTGTIGLQRLSLDGTTWVPVFAAWTTTANFAVVDLPPGTYRWAVATFTAVYVEVAAIPG